MAMLGASQETHQVEPESQSTPTTGWAGLPDDLLGVILQKLTVPDHVRFGCVCAPWNSAVKKGVGRPKPQPPWLMLPGRDSSTAQFFGLSENRSYHVPLPPPDIRDRVCIGSCFGWLITVHDQSEMHLLNPVTRVQVQLAPVNTLPYAKSTRLFYKAILSSAPLSDGTGDFTVILLHRPLAETKHSMAVTKIGDESWTGLGGPLGVVDVIQYNGMLYAINTEGKLYIWNNTAHQDLVVGPNITLETSSTSRLHEPRMMLVESRATGELLLLRKMVMPAELPFHLMYIAELVRRRNGGTREPRLRTEAFDAFTFVPETRRFKFIIKLGHQAIFVGLNHSMAVSTLELPELRESCIYFTDDLFDYDYENPGNCPPEIGVFDMMNEKVMPLDGVAPRSSWPPPIWITPTLQ